MSFSDQSCDPSNQGESSTPAAASQNQAPAAGTSRPGNTLNLSIAIGALALALIGQFFFSKMPDSFRDGLFFFALGVILFIILTLRIEPQPEEPFYRKWSKALFSSVQQAPLMAIQVFVSFVLSYTTVRFLASKPGNTSYWDVFAVWVLSCLVYASAFVKIPKIRFREWLRTNRWDFLLVLGLTAVAAALRFINLGLVPNIVSGDEGRIGLMAKAALNGELLNMMATTFGHSTLYLFIMAFFDRLFGVNPFSLRFTSALAGTLTVPFLYVFALRFFNRRVALIAAALLTVSHFHVHFSRIIVAGSIQDALFATVSLYLFLSALEERSPTRMMLSAFVMGFSFYIYMGGRLIVLMLPVYLLILLLANRDLVRKNLTNLAVFVGGFLVMTAPMLWWAVKQPNEFMARANQLGIFQSGWIVQQAQLTGKNQYMILFDQLREAFLTVNYFPVDGFYYSSYPMLDYISGAVFILGLVYTLLHIKDRRYLLLNGWFWASIVVGGALLVVPGKGAYRILMMFPAVCLFVALGWDKLIEFAGSVLTAKKFQVAAVLIIIAATAALNIKAYFIDYAPTCKYEDINTRFASYMGSYLGKLGPSYSAYLMGFPKIYYGIHPSVDYLSGGIPITNINDPLVAPPTFVEKTPAVFFFTPERENELAYVLQAFPDGKMDRIYDCGSPLLTAYHVP